MAQKIIKDHLVSQMIIIKDHLVPQKIIIKDHLVPQMIIGMHRETKKQSLKQMQNIERKYVRRLINYFAGQQKIRTYINFREQILVNCELYNFFFRLKT